MALAISSCQIIRSITDLGAVSCLVGSFCENTALKLAAFACDVFLSVFFFPYGLIAEGVFLAGRLWLNLLESSPEDRELPPAENAPDLVEHRIVPQSVSSREVPVEHRIGPQSVGPEAPAEDRIDPQIERLCIDPYVFFDEITKRTQGVVFDPNLFNLNFCRCIQIHTVTKDNTVRLKLEDMSIQAFKNTHPDKNAPITIVSIGPGGCFQELVYLAKLARAGYRNIDLKLIDIARLRVQMPLVSLREFCRAHLQGYNINICLYDLMDSYIQAMKKEEDPQNKERFKADLFLLIDINGSLPSDSLRFFARNQLLRAGSSVIAYIDKNQNPYEPYCLVFDGKDRDYRIRSNPSELEYSFK